MNVFEDLVVELKEENLLESTVMENDRAVPVEIDRDVDESVDQDIVDDIAINSVPDVLEENVLTDGPRRRGSFGLSNVEPPTSSKPEPPAAESADLQLLGNSETVEMIKPKCPDVAEFFIKRATGEISSLQLALRQYYRPSSGERMKIVPRSLMMT